MLGLGFAVEVELDDDAGRPGKSFFILFNDWAKAGLTRGEVLGLEVPGGGMRKGIGGGGKLVRGASGREEGTPV